MFTIDILQIDCKHIIQNASNNIENVFLLIFLSYCFYARGQDINNLTSVKAFTDFIAQIDLNMCQNTRH